MTRQEFEHIYFSIRSKLIGLAKRFSKSASIDLDAEDVVQEALIAFWELSEKGYPVRDPEALLVTITKNICVSRLRKQKLQTEPLVGDAVAGGFDASLDVDRMDEEIIRQRLYETLTRTEREYMLLKAAEGLSLDEIVQKTGASRPGIKTALSKAKRKLKEQFKKSGYDR